MKMETTITSRVYGYVLAYPGITSREINAQLFNDASIRNTRAVAAALKQLRKSGAIVMVPGETERSGQYFKGRAPAVLRQPAGQLQENIMILAEQRRLMMEYEAMLRRMEAHLSHIPSTINS